MKKIIHFISGKGLGGPKTVFLAHQKIFEDLGYDVTPVVRLGASLQSYFDHKKVDTISYWRVPIPFFRRFVLSAIRDYVNKKDPDLIWLHKPIDTLLWRLACPDKLIAVVVHGYQNKNLKYADFLIAVSPAVLRHLQSLGFTNVFLMNNFLHFDISDHPLAWHKPIRFSALGYYRRKKGFTDWLQALHMLHNNKVENKFEAHLCGKGRLSLKLKWMKYFYRLDKLTIHPWQKDSVAWISKMDVIVVPSRSESFGMVIIEAMAQGALVIATRSGGPQTIITDQETGILTAPKDPEGLYQAMLEVIENPDKWTPIREKGRLMVQKDYTYKAAIESMKIILNNIFNI